MINVARSGGNDQPCNDVECTERLQKMVDVQPYIRSVTGKNTSRLAKG